MNTNAALIRDVDEYQGGTGELGLWWLGQHSFIVKAGGKVIYMDPFLTAMEGRTVPPLLKAEEIKHADLIYGSHDHADHIDRPVWPALAAASPKAKFVVPEILRERLVKELGIPAERFLGLDDGKAIEQGGVKISAIAAAHEFLDRDEATGMYPYLGFITEVGGCTIYHAGDTCIYEGMQQKLRPWKLDLALLPINGRDAKRLAAGVIGNMTFQEAVDLAGTLRPGVTIPTHYEMFAMNSADPQLFLDYAKVKYPQVKTRVVKHGERVVLQF